MVSKADISRWTGLSGIQVDHIIKALEKKDIDWAQVIDWETLGGDVRDFAERYDMVWKKLGSMYGISKPVIETGIRREITKAEEKELEYLTTFKEGVKTLLRRIYEEVDLSEQEREKLKDKLLEMAPELPTIIALFDGREQEYAKRFIEEKVLEREEPVELPLTNLHRLKVLEARIKKTKEEQEELRRLQELILEPEKEKIWKLAESYSYSEAVAIAKKHDVRPGPKIRMFTELIKLDVKL